jgi:hypothetical protein
MVVESSESNLFLKRNFVLRAPRPVHWRKCSAVFQNSSSKKAAGRWAFGVRKRGFVGSFVHAQMVELALDASQAVADLAQTVGVGQMAEEHGDQLGPAGKAFGGALGLMFSEGGAKRGAWDVSEQLTKQTGGLYHERDSFAIVVRNSVW